MQADHTQQQSTEGLQQAQSMSLQRNKPPTDVPGIDVDRFLGSGAYGEVWVGRDQNTGRQVAIKFFSHRRAVDWSLLSQEVGKLVFLSADRYVVQLLDVGWDADPPYYVMEYVEHGSLDALIKREESLSIEDAVDIFHEIVVGLVHSHGKGILHCDLKPANILLDQDNKPRLADFGQSRLSHEQTPALGTLFYMAPEQADLEAIPDAQWDVYGLGAILYSMLTGRPPYRSEESVSRIDTAGTLGERLGHYRDVIQGAPRLNLTADIPGIDRTLADILQKCLARDSRDRYSNAQEILEELRNRAIARARRPMLILGIGGPILLLFIMALFGVRGYNQAVRNSQAEIRQRSFQGSRYAAQFVARTFENGIQNHFREVSAEADRSELHRTLQAVLDTEVFRKLQPLKPKDPDAQNQIPGFQADQAQQRLTRYLGKRLFVSDPTKVDSPRGPPRFASMFVTDMRGVILAVAYDKPRKTRSVGRNFSYRSYYHGQGKDLPIEQINTAPPIETTNLSAAFSSTTTKTWKVAVSTPVRVMKDGQERAIGLLIATINLGDFEFLDETNSDSERFAVLIDLNPDQGTILQHPIFDQAHQGESRQDYTRKDFRLPTELFETVLKQDAFEYLDPMSKAPGGEGYDGRWLAVKELVLLSNQQHAPHLAVVVQERFDAVTAPVRHLASNLVFEAMLALVGVICAVFVLWYFVLYVHRVPRGRLRGKDKGFLGPPTLRGETVDQP